MNITTDHDKGQGLSELEMTAECQHRYTHEETREQSVCRYVPSHCERENDDDPFETVTVRDVYVICDVCGECLEVLCGD